MHKKWVIPDIHGCALTLKALIEDKIQPTKQDELIFLGDYIDRGPDSKGVIDYIRKLQTDEYTIIALKGNHEDYCVQAWHEEKKLKGFLGFKQKNRPRKEWEMHGGKETLQSFNASHMYEIPEDYIDWMDKLDFYYETDGYLVVHAGLNFQREDPYEDKHAMLWVREYSIKPELIDNKKIIHGHVPVSLEFIDMTINSNSYKFIDLDNGVYMGERAGFGNLVSLELNSKELHIQPNMDQL